MLLMTHSLLSAWLRSMRDSPNEESETSLEEFMHVLRREKTPTTPAMQNGIDLEDLVTAILQGKKSARLGDEEYSVDQHPWYGAALKIAGMLGRAKLQYVATKTVRVDGVDFLLYGRLDALQAGEIFDIKYAGAYKRGKCYGSIRCTSSWCPKPTTSCTSSATATMCGQRLTFLTRARKLSLSSGTLWTGCGRWG